MSDLEVAIETQRQAEAALEAAKRQTREIAMRQLREAQEACRAVGIELSDRRSLNKSARSAAAKASWESKTPEQRAQWVANMHSGLRATLVGA